jgi:hypothetical protein
MFPLLNHPPVNSNQLLSLSPQGLLVSKSCNEYHFVIEFAHQGKFEYTVAVPSAHSLIKHFLQEKAVEATNRPLPLRPPLYPARRSSFRFTHGSMAVTRLREQVQDARASFSVSPA